MYGVFLVFYFTGWTLCLSLYGLITYNRRTHDSLGLYGVLSSPFAKLWEGVVAISLLLIPLLSIILIFRLKTWSWLRLMEVVLSIITWSFFLYNFSFYRG